MAEAQNAEADLCVFSISICEQDLWQRDTLQQLSQLFILGKQSLVWQGAVHSCVPLIIRQLVSSGLQSSERSIKWLCYLICFASSRTVARAYDTCAHTSKPAMVVPYVE